MTKSKPMPTPSTTSKFDPEDLSKSSTQFCLPNEIWMSILSHPCSFPGPVFLNVVDNLIRNPNISSSHLFRAEIFYDSDNDTSIIDLPNLSGSNRTDEELFSPYVKNLRSICRPRGTQVPDEYLWRRTSVRRLVPRNPQLDRDLVQTVHYFHRSRKDATEESDLVLQIPHVDTADELPWYHPAVRSLAIIHIWHGTIEQGCDHSTGQQQHGDGNISIHYNFFPPIAEPATDTPLLTDRLARTAYHLLNIIYRHGAGQLAGYTKRVHHDVIIPQSRFQDTYTRLKIKYAKVLINDWREQTDPGKHVFEDLGIAAFLIELWDQMYRPKSSEGGGKQGAESPPFPGFVDIGCGNGVLVHILISEGYDGWGFDARRRKSWDMFPENVQRNLKEILLVPRMLQSASGLEEENETSDKRPSEILFHEGVFPERTFIVSNHADELTPWTPIIASLNRSPFIAIPCCSHNFAGARFRAPLRTEDLGSGDNNNIRRTNEADNSTSNEMTDTIEKGKGHQSGSLKKPQLPSAYATLTSYVAHLATRAGYVSEKEMLRIPSTRNACILGRTFANDLDDVALKQREEIAKSIVEQELARSGQSLREAGREWVKRAMKLGSGAAKDCHETG